MVDPKEVSRGGADTSAMLGITKEEAEAIDSKFNFRIGEVKHMEAHEVNQELFDKIYGEGTCKDEAEFRGKVAEDLGKMFVGDTDRVFQRAVIDKLMAKTEMPLPDEFLKRWILQTNEKPLSTEQLEAEYPEYAKSLKWQLIQNKIIENNELQVQQEEVIAYTKGLLANQYAQYGMPAPEEEELTASAQKVLANQEEGKRIYDALYDNKVLQYFKDTVKIENKEISYDEFVKLASGQN